MRAFKRKPSYARFVQKFRSHTARKLYETKNMAVPVVPITVLFIDINKIK